MTAFSTPQTLREQIVPLLRARGVERAAVFGSFARGTQSGTSDLDLLVEFAEGRSLEDKAALETDLEELLGRPVEVVTYRALHPRVRDNAPYDQVVIV